MLNLSKLRRALFTAAFSVSAWNQASALVVIEVDISSLDAVVFNATDAFASTTIGSVPFEEGITFDSLFAEDTVSSGTSFLSTSSLIPWLNSVGESFGYGIYTTTGGRDLNLSAANLGPGFPDPEGLGSGSESDPQFFATDSIAFFGSAVADLSGFSFTIGSIGDIVLVTERGDVVIGQWQIIPEPAHFGVLLGLVVLAQVGRRRISL